MDDDAWFRRHGLRPEAALRRLRECENVGDFDDFSVERRAAQYDAYYSTYSS
jgi:hypothetical protein